MLFSWRVTRRRAADASRAVRVRYARTHRTMRASTRATQRGRMSEEGSYKCFDVLETFVQQTSKNPRQHPTISDSVITALHEGVRRRDSPSVSRHPVCFERRAHPGCHGARAAHSGCGGCVGCGSRFHTRRTRSVVVVASTTDIFCRDACHRRARRWSHACG